MNKAAATRLIYSRFGDYRDAGTDEIRVNCPFCLLRNKTQDVKYKLYINPVKDAVHCFRCDYAGRATDLLPQLISLGVDFEKIRKRDEDTTLEATPAESHHISELHATTNPGRSYVEGRGFGARDFDVAGGALYCEDYRKGPHSFGPRIIFPVYQFGVYRGFQARTIWKNTDPKYVNASGMNKRSLLYNFDNAFKQKEELIITEGIFDAIRVGTDKAVAAFGKAVSQEQIRLIGLGDFDRVILLLDRDAEKEGKASAHSLAKNHNTFVGFLPVKDPADMRKEELDLFIKKELRRVY